MATDNYSKMANKATKIMSKDMLEILSDEYTGMRSMSLGQEIQTARDATIMNFRVERVENGMILSIDGKRYIVQDGKELTEQVIGALVAQGFSK